MNRTASLLAILLAAAAPALAQEAARPAPDVRVALVAGDRTEALNNLAALAEARLTEGPGIQVLERRAVDRVLDEQKLTLSGLVAADSAVAVGKLLPVDLFAVLGAGADRKEAAGLVIFDARTGVRLWDAALPPGNLDSAAAAVVTAVRAARDKARAPRPPRAVCLLTVRNADLPRDQDALCDSVGLLLERRLVASPDLALLERRRLEQVNRERDLPTDSPLRQLSASVVTVALDVARDGPGLRATALLADGKGAELGRATAAVPTRDPEALALAVARETTRLLDARAGAAPASPDREAARFLREAEFWWEHKDPRRALPAAESAVALRPEDLSLRAALARGLIDQAADVLDPGGQKGIGSFVRTADPAVLSASLELARRGADLLADVEALPLANHGQVQHNVADAALTHYLQRAGVVAGTAGPEAQKAYAAVRAAQHRGAERRLVRAAAGVRDKASFDLYSQAFSHSLVGIMDPAVPSALRGDSLARLRPWADAARKYEDARVSAGSSLLSRALFVYRYPPPLDDAEAARQGQLWAELAEHPNAVIAAYGRIGRVAVAAATGKLSQGEKRRRVHDFRLSVQDRLRQGDADSDPLRYGLYLAARDGIDLLLNQPGYTEEITDLCDFMFARGELAPSIAQTAAFHLLARRTSDTARQSYDLLRRALAIVDGEGRFLSFAATPAVLQHDRDRMRVEYRRFQTDLRQRHPDLAAPTAAPWNRAEALIDVRPNTQGLVWIQQPVVHEGTVLVAGIRHTPGREGIAGAADGPPTHSVQLLRLSPGGSRPREGRPVPVKLRTRPWVTSGDERFRLGFNFATAACAHQGCYWLGTEHHGLFSFPLDDGPPQRLTTSDGLPSDSVQALAGLGDTLYAWLGEPNRDSYLVAWDARTRHCHVLASSRRQARSSPFDDNSPLLCSALLPDPARNRLLFAAYSPWTGHPLNGVWALDARTRSFERLFVLHHTDIASYHLFGPASRVEGDRLVMPTALGEFAYDLTKSQNRVTYGSQSLEVGPTRSAVYSLQLPPPLQSWKGSGSQVRAPLATAGGWLWLARPFARRSLPDARQEELASPRPGDLFFAPTECLRTFRNDRELLAGDAYGLWLLTLPEKK